jgi:hypothetical protein
MPPKLTHPYFLELIKLGLPTADFAVFGSGPLVAHGLKADQSDVDVIARGVAWKQALHLGEVGASSLGDPKVSLAGGRIEVFNTWGPGNWNVDELIDGADVVDGIRFVKLEHVLAWKKIMDRPKDGRDIMLIENYLAATKE